MSGALDDEARAIALELLQEYGAEATLTKGGVGAYNLETGTASATPAAHGINLYLDQPNKQELAGGQVLATDEVAIFPALGLAVVPVPGDSITIGGAARRIKAVGRIWSGAQVALWRAALES